VSITTQIVSSNPVHGEVYSIQHYLIKFVSDLPQVGGFFHRRSWHGIRTPFLTFCLHIYFKEHYKKGCTRLATASDKVYQLLAHGRWFSPGTPNSSTTKTSSHNIAEILLKVALNTKNQIKSSNHPICGLWLRLWYFQTFLFNSFKI